MHMLLLERNTTANLLSAADCAPDWFEDRSAEHREWLVKAVRRHLDEALSHRRFAHSMRRGGNIGLFKQWMRDATREVRMAKHYAKELKL